MRESVNQQAMAKPMGNLIAQLPWLPKPATTVKFEKSKFYEAITKGCDEEVTKEKILIYRLMNNIFPFYLPARYHSMDSISMQAHSKGGSYWANAAHFLLLNQEHGASFYYGIAAAFQTKIIKMEDLNVSFKYEKRNLMLSNDRLDQCKTPAEFLLEPWVLVQLPFQPSLMHQWTVALLAEALKLQTELAEFTIITHDQRLSCALQLLFKISSQLLAYANLALSHFFMHCVLGPNSLLDLLIKSHKPFLKMLPHVLPVLDFVMNGECANVIKALKRMNWSKDSWSSTWMLKYKLSDEPGVAADFGALATMYNLWYWKQTKPLSWLYETKDHKVDDVALKLKMAFNNAPFMEEIISQHDLALLTSLVDEKIIKAGRLKGENRVTILTEVTNHSRKLFPFYELYAAYVDTSSSSEGIEDGECGVIYNIITLYSDYKVAEALALFTHCIAELLINRKDVEQAKIYVNAINAEGPDRSFEDIMRSLQAVQPDDKWRYENIMKSIKKTCFSPDRTSAPDFDAGVEKVALHFQERIRNMVYKMIEKQSNSAKGPFHYVPECQMVQYLLPCYVAAFINMDKDSSVGKEEKLKYMHFLHEFIGCYEQREFVQVQTSLQKLTPYLFVAEQELMEELELDFEFSKSAFKNQVKNVAFITQAYGQAFQYLREAMAQMWLFKLESFRTSIWSGHLGMHFCRMRQCMINLGWLQVNKANICFLASIVSYQVGDANRSKHLSDLFKLLKYKRDPFSLSGFLMQENLSVDVGLRRDVALISMQQLTAIIIYLCLYKFTDKSYHTELFVRMQGPKFIFDTFSTAYWCILERDFWRLKKLIAPCMKAKNSLEDLSMATLKMAKKNRCYSATLKTLTADGRVQMSKPGEMTLFPVQHCRWCGAVYSKVFRLCSVCKDNPDYPDINYFCSEKCEENSLNTHHREEHERDLMIQLNMLP